MTILLELLSGFTRDDDKQSDDTDVENFDFSGNDSQNSQPSDDQQLDDPYSDDQNVGDEADLDGQSEFDGEDTESGDPDKQGLIRTVPSAHLVFKRKSEDDTFEELWMYNVSDLDGNMTIKRSILASTDIPVNQTSSADGSQTYELWSSGNIEMLYITGMPS